MAFSRNELDDYFMLPYNLEGVGDIYPAKIFEYERFRQLAGKYITQGITTLHNLYKVPKDTNVLDYFVNIGLKMDKELEYLKKVQSYKPKNEDEQNKLNELNEIYQKYQSGNALIYSIKELEELFTIVLRQEVKFNCQLDNPMETYCFEVKDNNSFINKDNFDEVKNIIAWQNILFEMPSSKDKRSNEMIQKAIKKELGGNENSGDLASICSIVSCNSSVSDNELKGYSYYRLIYDFTIINRQHGNIFSFLLRSQGVDVPISDLSEKVDLHKSPYGCIFKQHKHDEGNIK